MAIQAIVLRTDDNVATAVQEIKAGQDVAVRLNDQIVNVMVKEDIQYGHKFAVKDIRRGETILKYGEVIGRATKDIAAGYHAHVQNIESLRGRGDLKGRSS